MESNERINILEKIIVELKEQLEELKEQFNTLQDNYSRHTHTINNKNNICDSLHDPMRHNIIDIYHNIVSHY
jgi:chromosome segregation ATPase